MGMSPQHRRWLSIAALLLLGLGSAVLLLYVLWFPCTGLLPLPEEGAQEHQQTTTGLITTLSTAPTTRTDPSISGIPLPAQYATPVQDMYYEIPGFLTAAECDAIMAYASSRLTKSAVLNDAGTESMYHDQRVSFQTWIPIEQPVVQKLAAKAHDLTGRPYSHFEHVQVVKYPAGGRYDPHYDSCDRIAKSTCQERNPRLWTVLVYLNDDFQGGGTRFPKLNKVVKPEKGKALVFRVSDSEGLLYEDGLHGGDPVESGEKWIATQWVHVWPFKPPPLAPPRP